MYAGKMEQLKRVGYCVLQKMANKELLDHHAEINVPIKSGDLLVGDARLLHATHANLSAVHRTVITIWFHPFFADLLPDVQNYIHHEMHRMHDDWPVSARSKIEAVTPSFTGNELPMEVFRFADGRLE